MKRKLFIGLEILIATIMVIGVTVYAATAGTEADPLVSKSYVDDKINQVISMISTGSATSTVSGITGGSYEPVYATVGQRVEGGEGTEIILRSGKGEVYINGADGITDATTGANLKGGQNVTANHLMIVPRADGRGVKVTESAWFLIKGDYTIK